jgi:c-di-GMP-specific phosphodiesterase
MLPPDEFLPLIEEMGLMSELGAHMMHAAAKQLSIWRDCHPAMSAMTVSVNLSTGEIDRPGLVDDVAETLRVNNLPRGALKLEVTESDIMRDPERAAMVLKTLREAGAGLALDDFGTGFSSLSYLTRLPFDTLKIDRSLTFTSHGDLNEHVIRSIVALSHTLGLRAVVEGIEQPEQLPRFIDLGCGRFQGYLFSRPLCSGPCLDYIRANAGVAA